MKLFDKNIWFTADLHFGHKNVIGYCNRPFANVSEMNSKLIKNFNKTVGKNDIVYILGDLSFLNTKSTKEIVSHLNGFKFLVKGNHDPKTNTFYRKIGFIEVYDKPIILFNKYLLSHDIIQTNDFINIHGHTHQTVKNSVNNICVSVEMTDYKPISLDKINVLNNGFKSGELCVLP